MKLSDAKVRVAEHPAWLDYSEQHKELHDALESEIKADGDSHQ